MNQYIVVAVVNSDQAEIPKQIWSQAFHTEEAADECADWLGGKDFIVVKVIVNELAEDE